MLFFERYAPFVANVLAGDGTAFEAMMETARARRHSEGGSAHRLTPPTGEEKRQYALQWVCCPGLPGKQDQTLPE